MSRILSLKLVPISEDELKKKNRFHWKFLFNFILFDLNYFKFKTWAKLCYQTFLLEGTWHTTHHTTLSQGLSSAHAIRNIVFSTFLLRTSELWNVVWLNSSTQQHTCIHVLIHTHRKVVCYVLWPLRISVNYSFNPLKNVQSSSCISSLWISAEKVIGMTRVFFPGVETALCRQSSGKWNKYDSSALTKKKNDVKRFHSKYITFKKSKIPTKIGMF